MLQTLVFARDTTMLLYCACICRQCREQVDREKNWANKHMSN
jgi:hypothetical protein